MRFEARVALTTVLSLFASCGGPPDATSPNASSPNASPATSASVDVTVSGVATADPRPADSAAAAASTSPEASAADAGPPSRYAACVEVEISLDLRALPVHPSSSTVQSFGDSEAFEFVNRAPPGPPPRIARHVGTAGFTVFFDAKTLPVAKTRCDAAVVAYLKHAPTLAGSTTTRAGKSELTTAAHLNTPCRKCE